MLRSKNQIFAISILSCILITNSVDIQRLSNDCSISANDLTRSITSHRPRIISLRLARPFSWIIHCSSRIMNQRRLFKSRSERILKFISISHLFKYFKLNNPLLFISLLNKIWKKSYVIRILCIVIYSTLYSINYSTFVVYFEKRKYIYIYVVPTVLRWQFMFCNWIFFYHFIATKI